MLVEYEKDIGYYYLPQSISYTRKKFYVIKNYLLVEYYIII